MSSKAKTATMKNDDKFLLEPARRFPGFSAPWMLEPLSKVLKEQRIKNSAGRDVFSVSMESGVVNQVELLGRSYAAADASRYTIGQRFDVVYTKSPLKAFPFGIVKQCKFDGEVALSPLYGVFTPTNPHLGLMIEAYFESPDRSKALLSPLCQKGAKNTLQIANTTFLSGRLPIPTQTEEQKKIADCLTSVDELIAAQAKKVETLTTYKKGLMQQLFPCEGEIQPRRRFPEFQSAGVWKEEKLESLAKRGSGHTPNKTMDEYYNGGIKWVSLADSKRLDKGLISKTAIEISELGIKNSSAVLHPAGSVILSRDAGVGKSAILTEPMAVSQHFIVWRCDKRHITNWFLYYILQIKKPVFERVASGNTIKTIGLPFFQEMRISIPSVAEQQRIAECLTSLDDLIAQQTQKYAALKVHKNGLMQQLFPSSEEVEA
ncbi:restriction endonuclease subunit S [Rhizobium sp. 0TCS1.26]|uniref:restriction endonuclease subunit S n=1 Tax=Rhizobium sp. 0TCS1.26 TaxID=3142623 RepID=UPI003D2CEE5D